MAAAAIARPKLDSAVAEAVCLPLLAPVVVSALVASAGGVQISISRIRHSLWMLLADALLAAQPNNLCLAAALEI
jgi:hypothetical protein